MLHILQGLNFDLIAAEVVYHKACHTSYVSKINLKFQAEKAEDKRDEVHYEKAFKELVNDIYSGISECKAYDMTSLLSTLTKMIISYY